MKKHSIQISEISEMLGIPFIGANVYIEGLNLCNRETRYNSILSYIASTRCLGLLKNNESVKALFVSSDVYDELKMGGLFQIPTLFIVENPEVSFYYLHHLLLYSSYYSLNLGMLDILFLSVFYFSIRINFLLFLDCIK